MALRNQPYIPLYIQDFLTDERLIECSAQATGVYVRLMCIMHKSEDYGKILLKQKDKQTSKQVENFAYKVAKQMPYTKAVVLAAIEELLEEGVLHIEGDTLCQKRMIKDNLISLKRSKAGKKGGEFAQAKIKAKGEANSEYENEIENEDENKFNNVFSEAFDEITCDRYKMVYRDIDLGKELQLFRIKCDNDKKTYYGRDAAGLRTAFQYQLKSARKNGANKKQQHTDSLVEGIRQRWGTDVTG